MNPQLDLGDIVSILYENACMKFQKTLQYELLREKQKKMDGNCKNRLTPDVFEFVEERFDILLEAEGVQTEFVYHQGIKDCVKILKNLEIL